MILSIYRACNSQFFIEQYDNHRCQRATSQPRKQLNCRALREDNALAMFVSPNGLGNKHWINISQHCKWIGKQTSGKYRSKIPNWLEKSRRTRLNWLGINLLGRAFHRAKIQFVPDRGLPVLGTRGALGALIPGSPHRPVVPATNASIVMQGQAL